MVSDGLEAAIGERTTNFQDLVWGREGAGFELAIEADIPEVCTTQFDGRFDVIRYEVAIGIHPETHEVGILQERAILKRQAPTSTPPRFLFPMEYETPATILADHGKKGEQVVLSKAIQGNDNYYPEVRGESGGKGWIPSFRLGPRRSTLANLPEDESRFPASTWFK